MCSKKSQLHVDLVCSIKVFVSLIISYCIPSKKLVRFSSDMTFDPLHLSKAVVTPIPATFFPLNSPL